MRKLALAFALMVSGSAFGGTNKTPVAISDSLSNGITSSVVALKRGLDVNIIAGGGVGGGSGDGAIVDGVNPLNRATVSAQGALKTDATVTNWPATNACTQSGTWSLGV